MNTMGKITAELPASSKAQTIPLIGVLVTATLVLMAIMIADSANAADELAARKTSESFLQVYRPKLVLSRDKSALPQFCTKRRCPDIVSNYGVFHSPSIDDITAGYDNVRVSMYIRSISNTVVSGDGVDAGDDGLVWWNTSSAEADEEKGGPYAWTIPGPGETFDSFVPAPAFGARVYDALAFGACGSLTSFDISHSAALEDGGSQFGLFQATDNATINSTGYYNVDYSVRVTDDAGGVSDIRFKGKLNVLCSGLVGLP